MMVRVIELLNDKFTCKYRSLMIDGSIKRLFSISIKFKCVLLYAELVGLRSKKF